MAAPMTTRCCIAGGGPAGMMLGFLLARAGIDVVVLEKHKDFLRDFRGDTIHPSTLELMHELGLLSEFLKLPHEKAETLSGRFEGTLPEVLRRVLENENHLVQYSGDSGGVSRVILYGPAREKPEVESTSVSMTSTSTSNGGPQPLAPQVLAPVPQAQAVHQQQQAPQRRNARMPHPTAVDGRKVVR